MEQMLRVIGMRRVLFNPAAFMQFNERLQHRFGEKRLPTLFIYCENSRFRAPPLFSSVTRIRSSPEGSNYDCISPNCSKRPALF